MTMRSVAVTVTFVAVTVTSVAVTMTSVAMTVSSEETKSQKVNQEAKGSDAKN